MINLRAGIFFLLLITVIILVMAVNWQQKADTTQESRVVSDNRPTEKQVNPSTDSMRMLTANKASALPSGKTETSTKANAQEIQAMEHQSILDELEIKTDNDLIKYVYNEEQLLITEIDQNENSLSYKQPLKVYTYEGKKVSSLTTYQYSEDEIVETRIDVAYHSDGSIKDNKRTVITHRKNKRR